MPKPSSGSTGQTSLSFSTSGTSVEDHLAKSTSSRVVSPVKISRTRAKARGLPEKSRRSGLSSIESFASFDRDSFSWKTSQPSGEEGSTLFSAVWPRAGSMLSGIAFQRRPLAPLTDATASSWLLAGGPEQMWPTPDAGAFNVGEDLETWAKRREGMKAKGYNGNGGGIPLGIAVRLFPTPTVADSRGTARASTTTGKSHAGTTLTDHVRMFPTPTATDYKTASSHGQRRGTLSGRFPGGLLNPTWVEWLMDFPPLWTELF